MPWPPAFLAPGTRFLEDNFSMDGWLGGMVQAVMRTMGSNDEWQIKLCWLPAAHLLLCNLVPNRPWTGIGPWPGVGDPCRGWGPLP